MKHYNGIATALVVVASTCISAIEGFRFVPNPIAKLFEGFILKRLDVKILDDVSLPEGMTSVERLRNLFQFSLKTNKDVANFILNDGQLIEDMLGDGLKVENDDMTSYNTSRIQTLMINKVIKVDIGDPDPVPGYLYFGNKDFTQNLGRLCKTNPFFASALTASKNGDYLEINAYDPDPPSASDPLFLKLMRDMSDPSHRINVRFNLDMSVDSIRVFDENGNKKKYTEDTPYELDYYASGAIYNLVYFASAVHATIHILHYLMTACITSSTAHNTAFNAWAVPYDDNIAIKHTEVAALLFQSTRNGQPFGAPDDDKLVSGPNGFGASKEILDTLRTVLCTWGACKNAEDYMSTFLMNDLRETSKKNYKKVMDEAGILTEFRKHIENIESFGDQLSDAMKRHNAADHELTEEKIKTFMEGCGGGVSSIDSISSWVQLMSCTGLTHGCTLSYSRLFVVPDIMRWRNIKADRWDSKDTTLIGGTAGTIQGMTLDRHVFTDKMRYGSKWNTEPITEEMMNVLTQFDNKAEELKIAYKEDIRKRPDFREYGWIMTDFCPDGYDGKQATIATYI